MTRDGRDPPRGDCLSPTDTALLGNPLDFIHEDHLREREICAKLDRIAGADRPDADEAYECHSFLREELPLHLQDEEEDLFPMLLRRCAPDDEIDKAIARLTGDHQHADTLRPGVITLLAALESRRRRLSDSERARLTSYAGYARRHIILENAVILPIARVRLTGEDHEVLRQAMLQRRGLDRLWERMHAE